MSHTESPDFDRLAIDRELIQEARKDREEIKRLRAALGNLIRKGTDGRWYTTQHGDTDVTVLVHGAVEQKLDSK